MKQKIASLRAAVAAAIRRFFNSRPTSKRVGLVVMLLLPGFGLAWLIGNTALATLWALMLLSLFWGMGAERAALEWDATFSLPPVGAFVFWRWQPLEKKRFVAVLVACALASLGAVLLEALA